jgi:hypothetical protein
MGPEVMDFVTDGFEMSNNGVFEVEGAVVGSDGDAEGGVAHGRAGIQDRETRNGNRKFHPASEMAANPPHSGFFGIVRAGFSG